MQKWYQIFYKNMGILPYVWGVLYILPFYFIYRSSSTYELVIGCFLIITFFICYVLSLISKGWPVYVWISIQILISIAMSIFFGYVYFSIFLAFFIGNIKHRGGFITLYTIHLVSTIITINFGFVSENAIMIKQLPFVLISLIAVILLPVTTYSRNKSDKLQEQLEDANKRISELVKLEERQRIARDLHDTLGQKLSLIGLKSDLAVKLISKNPNQAQAEMNDVRITARSALKEVRKMVTQMRGTRVEDEIFRIRQILKAANINFTLEGDPRLTDTSLLNENVVSMCLKEALTNIVRHSRASACFIQIIPTPTSLMIKVQDNGIGLGDPINCKRGNGLQGMKERLEFVNGSLDIQSANGTLIIINVPNVLKQQVKETEL